MNMCEECGVNVANVHLTQIMQNETHVFHLCEECAKKKGISLAVGEEEMTVNMENLTATPEPDKACPQCGLKMAEFKSKGWLGCSQCYRAFEPEIDELFVQVHGSAIHKGKKYTHVVSDDVRRDEINRLRTELATAIKNEEFEQAATIRDAIHSLKQIGCR